MLVLLSRWKKQIIILMKLYHKKYWLIIYILDCTSFNAYQTLCLCLFVARKLEYYFEIGPEMRDHLFHVKMSTRLIHLIHLNSAILRWNLWNGINVKSIQILQRQIYNNNVIYLSGDLQWQDVHRISESVCCRRSHLGPRYSSDESGILRKTDPGTAQRLSYRRRRNSLSSA